MAGSAGPATFTEAMSDVASDLGRAIMLPDADVQFGMSLFTAIVGWTRQKGMQAQQRPPGAPGGPGGPPGMGGPPGQSQPGAPGGAPPGLQMPGATPGNATNNPQQPSLGAPVYGALGRGTANLAPNPDELRRVIQQLGAGG